MMFKIKKISSSEYLANYLNNKLKIKKNKKLREDELKIVIDKAIQLFIYISDKDLFLDIYKNQLAKRLLQEKSEDRDTEQKVISNIQTW